MSNNKKYTRLDLMKRIQIQSNLNEGASLSSIARLIGVSAATVSREIKAHRIEDNRVTQFHHNSCVNRKTCKRHSICPGMEKICRKKNRICSRCSLNNCNTLCPDYQKEVCRRPDKPPYVCNHCPDFTHSKCPLTKYLYKAAEADNAAAEIRSSSRSGINLTPEELQELNCLLTPRIRKGQSLHHIMASEPDVFAISERQAYRLVNEGLIAARPIDMPRAVRMKPRKRKAAEKKVDRNCRKGRTYNDSSVWLLDNGSEFSNPSEIEKYGIHVFYCDPSAPYQKGCCEVTHKYVRRVLSETN